MSLKSSTKVYEEMFYMQESHRSLRQVTLHSQFSAYPTDELNIGKLKFFSNAIETSQEPLTQ